MERASFGKVVITTAMNLAIVLTGTGLVAIDHAEAARKRNKPAAHARHAGQPPVAKTARANDGTVQKQTSRKDSGDAHLDYAVGPKPTGKDSGDAHIDYVVKPDGQ